jgi:hypothetical protein
VKLSPTWGIGHDDVIHADVLEPHTFHPLFTARNLEIVVIDVAVSFEKVDNSLIQAMASAWPRLRQLILRSSATLRPPSKVTIEGLLPLAGCGRLESVAMILDGKAPDTTSTQRPDNGASNLSLSILEVGHSLIDDPHAAASFLSDVFPRLIIIAWPSFNGTEEDDPEGWEMSIRWDEAVGLYHSFVDIRTQERLWAATAGGESGWSRYVRDNSCRHTGLIQFVSRFSSVPACPDDRSSCRCGISVVPSIDTNGPAMP